MRGESTARRVNRRTVLIADEKGTSLACPDCGGRGDRTPEMVEDNIWSLVGSPCDSPGCGGVIEEITIEEANARLAEGVRS